MSNRQFKATPAYSLLPTPYSLLPTPYSLLPIASMPIALRVAPYQSIWDS
ncbi:hypothetical protein [Moorena sp. SIO1G6]|nr:hypothetical protein [Moorena sp. SIO1G6]